MQPGSASGERSQRQQELWAFVVEQVAGVANPADARKLPLRCGRYFTGPG